MSNALSAKHNTKSLLKFAMPTIIMTVFMSMYTMVDGLFVSNVISSQALAGLNIVIPGLSILVAFAVLISAGGSLVIARKLGEGQSQEARQLFTSLVFGTTVAGLAITVLGLFFADPILHLLGATDTLYPVAYDYYRVLLCFATSCLLQVQFQYFFITAGHPQLGLICVVAGGISNIVLDYLFIVPMNMGIKGAALATGIGYSIPAVTGILYFSFCRKELLYFVFPRIRWADFLSCVIAGASTMIINLAGALVTWLYNRCIVLYLGDTGIAAATIVLYARYFFNSILSGYCSGVVPVISFKFGQKDYEQIRVTFRTSLRAVLVLSALVVAVCLFLAEPIALLFAGQDANLVALAIHGIRLFALSYLCNGINTFAASLFATLSQGGISALMSALHTFVFLTGAMWLLPLLGLGVDGIWLATPAAELCSLFLSLYFLKKKQKDFHY